jgi:hypothetical protein
MPLLLQETMRCLRRRQRSGCATCAARSSRRKLTASTCRCAGCIIVEMLRQTSVACLIRTHAVLQQAKQQIAMFWVVGIHRQVPVQCQAGEHGAVAHQGAQPTGRCRVRLMCEDCGCECPASGHTQACTAANGQTSMLEPAPCACCPAAALLLASNEMAADMSLHILA